MKFSLTRRECAGPVVTLTPAGNVDVHSAGALHVATAGRSTDEITPGRAAPARTVGSGRTTELTVAYLGASHTNAGR